LLYIYSLKYHELIHAEMKKLLLLIISLISFISISFAQITGDDIVVLLDGSTKGTDPSEFQVMSGDNITSVSIAEGIITFNCQFNHPDYFPQIGLYYFDTIDLSMHNKMIAKVKLVDYNKGFGIELRGKARTAGPASSEYGWDLEVGDEAWTNGSEPGADTKRDVLEQTGEWSYYIYEILNWQCNFPAVVRIDSTKIYGLTPYYHYKTSEALEHDIQIDYIVMVKPEVTLEEAKEYMGDDYVYPSDGLKKSDDNDQSLKIYVNNYLKQLNIISSNRIYNVSIINILGQVVKSRGDINQNSYSPDISGLRSGIYIINIDNRSYKIYIE
jgi:hypothetical protein